MANIYNKKTVAVNKASVGDQTSSTFTYKGFSSQRPKEGFKLYDIDLVKQDLINHFYIKKGEKLQNPEFGTIIWDTIFEPFTEETKKLIADDVETIVNYDPRVVVDAVSIDSTEMGMRIEASVTYLPFNVSDKMSFNFDRTTSTIK